MRKISFLAFLFLVLCLFNISVADSLPKFMERVHGIIIERWLIENPKYRLLTDEDCRCDDEIKMDKKSSAGGNKNFFMPSFHPYYVSGDFNGDGVEDFAVAVESASDAYLTLLVFNGPFKKIKNLKPTLLLKNALSLGGGLAFYPKRKFPRLIFGPFESDTGCSLEPSVNGYKLDCGDDE